MKKERYSLLLIILGSVSLNILNLPFLEIYSDDKEIFKYAGLVIYKGGVPYRDFFDHKPPLIYFLNSLNWFSGTWLPWLLDTLLVLFATLLFYWLCKKAKLAFPWFLPLIFNLLIRYSLVSYGTGMTREYTTVFLLMFFCVMQGTAKYKFYLMGFLAGIAFWMQQDSMITFAPFILYSLFATASFPLSGIGKKLLAWSTGFIVVSLPIISYFIFHKSLAYMWSDAFAFNLHTPGATVGIFEKIKNCKHALHEVEFEMPFYVALTLGTASLFLKPKKPALLYVSILALFLSFAAELISGRMKPGNSFVYYLLPLAATIPILVYVVFTDTQVFFLQDKRAQLIFSITLSTTLVLGTLRYASGFTFSGNKENKYTITPGLEYLKTQSLSDYQLFVFDDSNFMYLYNYFGILSPSPWIYQYFWSWSPNWDADDRIFHTILTDLRVHKTRFILDCSESRSSFKNRPAYGEWQKFLNSNYAIISRDSSNRKLWGIQ
jgi:hypothetical protein